MDIVADPGEGGNPVIALPTSWAIETLPLCQRKMNVRY